ncbi:hypothetical protein ES708_32727 [subsurface metagenome]
MNCINNPLFLREKNRFHLCRGSNPVTGANYNYWAIKIIKSKLGNIGSNGVEKRTTFTGIRDKN